MPVSSDRMYLQQEDGTLIALRAVGGIIQASTNGTDWADIEASGGGGGTVVSDGVSIDGVGSAEDPLAAIPAYFTGLTGYTRIAVGANAQDQDITIDGESVGTIEVIGYVPNNNAAASTLSIQPNAVSTNQSYIEITGSSAPAATAAKGALLMAGFAPASGRTLFRFQLITKTGTTRFYFGNYMSVNSSNVITNQGGLGGEWNEAATAITSVRLHSDRADGIKAGSVFWWRSVKAA